VCKFDIHLFRICLLITSQSPMEAGHELRLIFISKSHPCPIYRADGVDHSGGLSFVIGPSRAKVMAVTSKWLYISVCQNIRIYVWLTNDFWNCLNWWRDSSQELRTVWFMIVILFELCFQRCSLRCN
jgi:hypothetical protein